MRNKPQPQRKKQGEPCSPCDSSKKVIPFPAQEKALIHALTKKISSLLENSPQKLEKAAIILSEWLKKSQKK